MTRRRRETSADERVLFQESVKSPFAKRAIRTKPGDATTQTIRKPSQKEIHPGLDGNTRDRLRRGELEPDARIDLHGLTEAAAHQALIRFLRGAHARHFKLVLVVTGKGRAPDPHAPFDLELQARARGVLSTMTPRWLKEPDLAPLVAEVRNAHRRHGGTGALYVYLRKSRR